MTPPRLGLVRVACLALLLLASVGRTRTPDGALAITDVTVIDGTGAAPRAGLTVLVRGGRITAVGPSRELRVPGDAERIDGRGRFLIPGLCDAHAHLYHGARMLAVLLAHGVTCVEHMWGQTDSVVRWRREIDAGVRLGPAILAVAGEWPESRPPGDAARVLDSLVAAGATFVKTSSEHPAGWYAALAADATRRRVPFLGHLPYTLRAGDALALGPARVEHLATQLLLATSAREDELFPRWSAAVQAGDRAAAASIVLDAVASFSAEREAVLLAALVRRGVAVTPTLVNHRAAMAAASDSDFARDARLALFPDSTRRAWAEWRARQRRAPAEAEQARRIHAAQRRLVGAMRRAGVRVLAGSDVGDHYRYYGSSLHDELALLVDAGLTPMEALLAATREPAAALGVLAERGTVAAGKAADLVLLDGDPAADIANVRRVHAVVARGRLLRPSALRAPAMTPNGLPRAARP